MTIEQVGRLIGSGKVSNRSQNDFYATPTWAIQALLEREQFEGEIWEPCCGDGAISKCLKENEYWHVTSTDLNDYGYGETGINFLNDYRIVDNIITNPPFNIGTEITIHALNQTRKKVAIFHKLAFLEGKKRKDLIFSQRNLKSVYVFSKRVSFVHSTKTKSGMMAFAWYVWDHSYKGLATIDWI